MNLKKYEKDMQKAIKQLEDDLSSISTGKANSSMVKDVSVFVKKYGSSQNLNELANISVLDASSIKIEPWDKSIVDSIETAIHQDDMGLTPLNKGDHIMIKIPQMTQDRRKQLVKTVNQKGEEAKIEIRKARQEAKSDIKKQFENNDITEDQKRVLENNLNDLKNKYYSKVEKRVENKSKKVNPNG